MHKNSNSLAFFLLMTFFLVSAGAAPANPLVRPSQARNIPDMPPVPTAPPGPLPAPGVADVPASKTLDSAQFAMGKFSVVAILGDTAILRTLPGIATSMAENSVPQQQQPPTPNSVNTAATGAPLSQSIRVKNGQRILFQDVSLTVEVQPDQVILRTTDRNRAIFSGRLDGLSQRSQKGVRTETADPSYMTRNSLPGGLSNASANAIPGTGSVTRPPGSN